MTAKLLKRPSYDLEDDHIEWAYEQLTENLLLHVKNNSRPKWRSDGLYDPEQYRERLKKALMYIDETRALLEDMEAELKDRFPPVES